MKSEFDSLSSNDSFVKSRLILQSNSKLIDKSNKHSIENDDSKTENIIFIEQKVDNNEKEMECKEIYER